MTILAAATIACALLGRHPHQHHPKRDIAVAETMKKSHSSRGKRQRRTKPEADIRPSETVRVLNEVAKDLTYPSETDAPIRIAAADGDHDNFDTHTILLRAGLDESASVAVVSLDSIFDQVTTMQDWYGDEEQAACRQFQLLKDTIVQALHDINVLRVGERTIDIVIVGTDSTGSQIFITTHVVET